MTARLIVFIVLLLALFAEADAQPTCFPGDAAADQALPHLYTNWAIGGAGVYIYCDVGHKWQPRRVVAAFSEFSLTNVTTLLAAAAQSGDWLSLWNQAVAASTSAPTPTDIALLAAIDALPLPTAIPPSGLVTTDPQAYYIVQQADKLVMLPVGTVKPDTPLDTSQSADGFYVIKDRTAVTWYGNTKPPVIWGR